jgi:hypothetical protein
MTPFGLHDFQDGTSVSTTADGSNGNTRLLPGFGKECFTALYSRSLKRTFVLYVHFFEGILGMTIRQIFGST